ncbi:AlpA family phage regulatory protein, partial [Salmonella enterica]|nr:AlpA family phage regulatory protein [Salmonella enterica]
QVKTGIRAVAFIESEIDEWIEATIQNSRQNAA